MATGTQPTSAAGRRAQLLRGSWNRVKGPSATALGAFATFFLFHPPLAQGVYYLLRGLWPLFRSGGRATAEDVWLAQSGGLLTLVVGAVLCLAAYRRKGSPEIILLAFGCALSLTVLELIFVFQERIPKTYLLDAVIQVGLVASWVSGWRKSEQALAQAARVSQPTTGGPPVAAVPEMSQPALAR